LAESEELREPDMAALDRLNASFGKVAAELQAERELS
jgi:hypothetical protein